MTNPSAERWQGLPGNPRYFVSTHGQVRGPMGRILKPCSAPSGHQQIVISDGTSKKSIFIHVLVLLTFIGPPPAGMEALHKDGNPAHNRLWNLRWGTRADNQKDLVRHSGKWPRSSLTYEIAREIRAKYNGKRGIITKLAKEYGTQISVIHRIVHNHTYKELLS